MTMNMFTKLVKHDNASHLIKQVAKVVNVASSTN